MFENIKYEASKHRFLASLLFGIIILVFAFWTYYPLNDTQSNIGFAARVNNQIISVREYREAVERMAAFYAQMFGGKFDAEAQKQMRLHASAMEQLISREAAVQAADQAGLLVTNEEVRDVIVSIPAFQEDGKFKREFYDGYLANRRMSAAQFESDIKRSLVFEKAQDLFNSTFRPSEIELTRLSQLGATKLNVEFIKVDTAALEVGAKVNPAEIAQFLGNPESAKRAKDYFEANRKEFEKDEQVKARHILVKFDPAKPETESTALEKAKKLKEELAKTPFDVLAKKESEDLGSKEKGGDLGFFERGRMVKAFEEAAFNLPVGQVSDPVKSEFGYHLIKVEAKQPKQEADFEKVKNEISKRLLAQGRAAELETKIKTLAQEGKVSELTQLLNGAGMKWEETGSFTLADESVPKIGDDENVFKAVSSVTPESPFYKGLVGVGAVSYVFRLKSKTAAESDKSAKAESKSRLDTRDRLAMGRARDAFSRWADGVVKSSKVERNMLLLKEEM